MRHIEQARACHSTALALKFLQAFYKKVNDELKDKGSPMHLEYLSREVGNFCAVLESNSLPPALQCTVREIKWAARGAKEVETLWIPARSQKE